ncbi:MAG TPA: hypothetical protein VFC99_22085 [Acidimicrobiia bacterium]|nr:hypothetical protein [Acidimicrobiia bacterium]
MPGVVYNMQPQPPVEENTRWFDAGAVTIGVEYREVDPASLVETYKDSPEDMAELEEKSPEGGFSDEGVSLHVRGTDDGHEYVRFDVFDAEPHYHYVRPTGDHNNVVPFDPVADGEMLPWALDRLRTRLGDMLAEAGGSALVPRLDPALLGKVVDEVGALAEQAQRNQRAARPGCLTPLTPRGGRAPSRSC